MSRRSILGSGKPGPGAFVGPAVYRPAPAPARVRPVTRQGLLDDIARCRAACEAMARRRFVGYPGRPALSREVDDAPEERLPSQPPEAPERSV